MSTIVFDSDLNSETSTEGEDLIGLPIHHHSVRAHKNSKVKSSLCRNFSEFGICPYGLKCQFAHGLEELRCNNEHSSSYKTKPCNSFTKKNYCRYGYRCNFSHKNEEKRFEYLSQEEKENLRSYRKLIYEGKCMKGSRVLKGFQK